MKQIAPKIRPLSFENYLTMVRASGGALLWRSLYFRVGGERRDILKNGELSCAFYVSSILKIFDFAGGIHATVEGTVRDLTARGWKKTRAARAGDVVVWTARTGKSGKEHPHIGIALDSRSAMNHNDSKKVPMRHPINYRPVAYFLRCPEKSRT